MIIKKATHKNLSQIKILAVFFVLFALIFAFIFNKDFITLLFNKNPVEISHPQHFYSETISVTLSSPIDNVLITYTLDGSSPTSASQVYIEPIEISQTTVVQAAAFKDNQQIGSTLIHDYFINTEHSLPVVTLNTDSKNLWDEELGIYTVKNYEKKGKDWERPGVITFYETDQIVKFQNKINYRLHGAGSKNLPQKSFRIQVSDKNFPIQYQIFPDSNIDTFYSLILRNAGGDWSYTHLRDPLIHEVVSKTDLDIKTQNYRPAVLYINGEYWGIYNIRERQDQEYFSVRYSAEPESFNIYSVADDYGENRGKIFVDEGDDTTFAEKYNDLLLTVQDHCVGCASPDTINHTIDWINFRDYLIVELFFDNYDWPYSNSKLWRFDTPLVQENNPEGFDGKFRYLLFDLDVGLGFSATNESQISSDAEQNSIRRKFIDDKFPFRNLIHHPNFYTSFLNKFADLLNTDFSSESLKQEIANTSKVIKPEMPAHLKRWHTKDNWNGYIKEDLVDETVYITDFDNWQQNLSLLDKYVEVRPNAVRNHLVDEFNLSGTSQLTINVQPPESGYLRVNSLYLDDVLYPWTGIYFNDISLGIEAIPNSGYKFIGWESPTKPINKTTNEIFIQLQTDTILEAKFEKK